MVIERFPRYVSPRIPRTVSVAGPCKIRSTALGLRPEPKSGIVKEPGNFSGAERVKQQDPVCYICYQNSELKKITF